MQLTKKFLTICSDKTIKEAYKLYADKTYLAWGNTTPKSFDEFKQSYCTSDDYHPVFAYFKEKKLIGYGLVMSNCIQHKRLDIGYAIIKKQRKKGFGDYICKDLIKESKTRFNPNLILADVFGDNEGSEKILYKNGFVKSGEIPDFNLATGKPRKIQTFYLKPKN
jgi:RimJ/RimL family protein N-acetyltransferase